jgi:lysophospholipid acyltransferase (LPLAT)-like uncharacterized protein
MAPLAARFLQKSFNKNYRFMTLASKHGDGNFVSRTMSKFGFKSISGSSQNGRKSSRGIDLHSLRALINWLKSGNGIGITPDGPRGPNQKINSEIINIAKLSGSLIVPLSCSYSRFILFNSWDKFKFPLPFCRLVFYFGKPIEVNKQATLEETESLKVTLENELNSAQKKSDEISSV